MYDWEYELIEYVRELKNTICILEKELNKYPKGTISISVKKDGRKEYFHRIHMNGKRFQKYLSVSKNNDLIEKLLAKQQDTPALKDKLRNIFVIYKHLLPKALNVLNNIKINKQYYQPFFSENSKNPEHLKYRTLRGEIVRSISEKTIADALFRYNLDYKYEKSLQLGNIVIYPDFTIINPINGKTYYWEFLGLNTDEYLKSWDFKVSRFAENNISRENYLIVSTMEEINSVDDIIRNNFTLDRYKNLFS